MLHLIKTKMFPSFTNSGNNTSKIPLQLPYREADYKCFFFFQKAKFVGKLVLHDK